MIQISVNNSLHNIKADACIHDLVEQLGYSDEALLGIALNQTFVPKKDWPTTSLKSDDQVDLLKPVSGG